MAPAIELHLRIRVKPGRRDDFLAFLDQARPFYEQPGGIRVRLLEDHTDPLRFIELIEYQDEDTYQRDQKRVADDPTMKMYLDQWRLLLEQPPVVEVYLRTDAHRHSS